MTRVKFTIPVRSSAFVPGNKQRISFEHIELREAAVREARLNRSPQALYMLLELYEPPMIWPDRNKGNLLPSVFSGLCELIFHAPELIYTSVENTECVFEMLDEKSPRAHGIAWIGKPTGDALADQFLLPRPLRRDYCAAALFNVVGDWRKDLGSSQRHTGSIGVNRSPSRVSEEGVLLERYGPHQHPGLEYDWNIRSRGGSIQWISTAGEAIR